MAIRGSVDRLPRPRKFCSFCRSGQFSGLGLSICLAYQACAGSWTSYTTRYHNKDSMRAP
eukprot:6194009-Pleurochrysis_carterae.AAC.1